MSTNDLRHPVRAALAVFAAVSLLGACGGTSTDIDVTDAWARTSAAVANAGAAYMEIVNGSETADALIAATVDPSVAAPVEMHETVAMASGSDTTMGGGMESVTTMAGEMMEMRPVDRIDIPAGESVSLEPGGFHLMFIDLVEPLETGTTITLTLTFEGSGEKVVTADVLETAP